VREERKNKGVSWPKKEHRKEYENIQMTEMMKDCPERLLSRCQTAVHMERKTAKRNRNRIQERDCYKDYPIVLPALCVPLSPFFQFSYCPSRLSSPLLSSLLNQYIFLLLSSFLLFYSFLSHYLHFSHPLPSPPLPTPSSIASPLLSSHLSYEEQ
jgi:hypothetical protein